MKIVFLSVVVSFVLISGNIFGQAPGKLAADSAKTKENSIFPNAFTPNMDGKNDRFMPHSENLTEIRWTLFNRWGEVIFETRSLNGYWDGVYKGKPAPAGIYVYSGAAVSRLTGKSFNFKGNVDLIR